MPPAEEILQRVDPGADPVVRLFAGRVLLTLAVVGAVVATAMVIVQPGASPGQQGAYGPTSGDAGRIAATPTTDGVYVGYPTALYDPQRAASYDEGALRAAVADWRAQHPDATVLGAVRVEAPDGTLLGYRLVTAQTAAV